MEEKDLQEGSAAVGAGSNKPGSNKPNGEKPKGPNKTLNIVLAAVLVLAVVGGFAATRLMASGGGDATVVVRDGDGNETTYPLSEDADFTVTTDKGWNHVVIENNTVRVESADCPHQDCVDQGAISSAGQQIVCLPHEFIVSIVEEGATADYDVLGS